MLIIVIIFIMVGSQLLQDVLIHNYNSSRMEDISDLKKPQRLAQLVMKIAKLRRKLLSYGWGPEQVSNIILIEFLKMPEIDWQLASSTNAFYQTKDHYHVDSGVAELIIRIQSLIPNSETKEVCEYLLSVLQYNSYAFGFDLSDSSSESNQDFSHLRKCSKSKLTLRREKCEKRKSNHHHLEQKLRKKKCYEVTSLNVEPAQIYQKEVETLKSWKRKPLDLPDTDQKPQKKLKKQ